MSNTIIGNVPVDVIALQVASLVRQNMKKAETLMSYDDEQWDELFAASFGANRGSVRIEVIRILLEAESPTLKATAA